MRVPEDLMKEKQGEIFKKVITDFLQTEETQVHRSKDSQEKLIILNKYLLIEWNSRITKAKMHSTKWPEIEDKVARE